MLLCQFLSLLILSSARIQLPSSMISEVKCGVSVVGVGDFGEVEISRTRKINLSIK